MLIYKIMLGAWKCDKIIIEIETSTEFLAKVGKVVNRVEFWGH